MLYECVGFDIFPREVGARGIPFLTPRCLFENCNHLFLIKISTRTHQNNIAVNSPNLNNN